MENEPWSLYNINNAVFLMIWKIVIPFEMLSLMHDVLLCLINIAPTLTNSNDSEYAKYGHNFLKTLGALISYLIFRCVMHFKK